MQLIRATHFQSWQSEDLCDTIPKLLGESASENLEPKPAEIFMKV